MCQKHPFHQFTTFSVAALSFKLIYDIGVYNMQEVSARLLAFGPNMCEYLKNKKPTRCHLLFYCTSYRLNMFRALLCPSSRARDCNIDYHIGRFILGLLYVGG